MSTLTLTLPPESIDAGARLAYVLSTDGLSVASQDTVALGRLPTAYDELVAVVPAGMLSWHQMSLPAGSLPRGMQGERAMTRLRAILDGLLEDRLLDDPAQLHLALQPQAGMGSPVWVAACNRAWLASALAALDQAGHTVRRIVPELTPQSLAGTVLMAGDPDAPWVAGMVQTMPHAGASSEAQADTGLLLCALNATALTRLNAVAQEHDTTDLPVLLAEPALAAMTERLCQRPAVLQQRSERLLLASQSNWNLAQFEFANLGRNRRWSGWLMAAKSFLHAPQWRAARLAVIVLVMVNLIGLNALAMREQTLLADKRDAVRAVLTDNFPRIPVVVDAPLQMAREVAALQRNSGQAMRTDLESMLAALAASAPANPGLSSLDYEANQLRFSSTAMGDMEPLAARLTPLGLGVSAQADQWLLAAGAQP